MACEVQRNGTTQCTIFMFDVFCYILNYKLVILGGSHEFIPLVASRLR
jgi:hypothetical protein